MTHFLKYRVWDLILCVCISTGLVFHIYSGFLLEDAFSSNVWKVVGVLAVESVALILFSYNRLTTGIGIGVGIILLALFLAYARSNDVFIDETGNSLCIALSVTVLTGLLVYLASRSRPGLIALFLAGNIVMAGSAFLQFPVKVWGFLLFNPALCILFWYRNYVKTLRKVQSGKVRMPGFLLQTCVICMVAFVLAGGIYGGIVRPLNPPTRDLKLITRLKQMEILKVTGVYNVIEYFDPEMASGNVPDGDMNGQEDTEEQKNENPENESSQNQKPDIPQEEEETPDRPQTQVAQEVWYDLHEINIPWLIIIIAALIAATFLTRYYLKKRWECRVKALQPESRIVNYYMYFYSRLSRTGYKKPKTHTFYEYARDMEHPLETFADGKADFMYLTDIYIRTFYGRNPVTAEEVQLFEQFYGRFHKALRKEIGIFKYFINIFRI